MKWSYEKYCNYYMHFELGELYFGSLELKFYQRGSIFSIFFEEKLTDGVPGMIRMYNALKNGKPYEFILNEFEYCCIETSNIHDGMVRLTITARSNIGEDWGNVMYASIPIEFLLNQFEKFFDDLLHHPDFPFQYPLRHELDNKHFETIEKLRDLEIKRLHLTDKQKIHELEKHLTKLHFNRFSKNGQHQFEVYKEMLVTKKVPDQWYILRRKGFLKVEKDVL